MKATGGLLPITPMTNNGQSLQSVVKSSTPRLKLVIRRLPPGLTESEFNQALSDEWLTGGGKVDWHCYREGKVSKELAKPSRPSRAYLHVVDQSYLDLLNEKIRRTSFADSRNTSNDAALLGPPSLEYAPYGRTPTSKRRNDVRQGLIDQDSEFIEFLEGLTNPIRRSNSNENTTERIEKLADSSTVTPLIQHLRDKKAAKEKMAGGRNPKHSRNQSKNDNPGGKREVAKIAQISKDSTEKHARKGTRATRPGKSQKVPTKTVKKDVTSESKTAKVDEANLQVAPGQGSNSTKKSTPCPATAAARMLQRDLGLREGKTNNSKRHARGKTDAEPLPKSVNPNTGKGTSGARSTNSITALPVPVSSVATPGMTADVTMAKGTVTPSLVKRQTASKQQGNSSMTSLDETNPVNLSKSMSAASQSVKSSLSQAGTTTSGPSTTSAFLKHANPSQGITEPLIEVALSEFGAVKSVEIDKRKGFAYVEFTNTDSLRKAIAASPVAIAQGNVQILERKERGSRNASVGNRSNENSNTGSANASSARSGNTTKSSSRNKGTKGAQNKNLGSSQSAASPNSPKELMVQPNIAS